MALWAEQQSQQLNYLEVLSEIGNMQEDLLDLCWSRYHHAVYDGDLVPGCRLCLRRAWTCIHLGMHCNLDCTFCPIERAEQATAQPKRDAVGRQRDLAVALDGVRAGKLAGVSFSGGEPLLYLDELEQCAHALLAINPDLHLWLYTNGALATSSNLRRIRDLGISEIRINLAASGYSLKSLDAVRLARSIFPYVVVEVATVPAHKRALLKNLSELDAIGIDQLNMQEVVITPANLPRLSGLVYSIADVNLLYGSRRLTYEAFQECRRAGHGFTCVDCSAGVKRMIDLASPLGY